MSASQTPPSVRDDEPVSVAFRSIDDAFPLARSGIVIVALDR